MTLEELKNLKKHYRTVKEDAAREIARLRGEIAESEALLPELEEKRLKAMKAADKEVFASVKSEIEMHKERIASHRAVIVDLEEGHLIDVDEFSKVTGELYRLQTRITNETAAKFLKCIEELKAITSDYEDKMRTCDGFGKYLQEEVFRKRSQYNFENIESRTVYGFTSFSRLVRQITGSGVDYSNVERRAANVLKAEAAARLGMKDKAKKAAESE